MRILPELIDCDVYRFLEGDAEMVNAYFGEYMSQYTWAASTEARLSLLQARFSERRKTHADMAGKKKP